MRTIITSILLLTCLIGKCQFGVNVTPVKSIFLFSGESNAGGKAANTSATTAEKAKRTSYILNNNTLQIEQLHIGVNNLLGHDGISNVTGHDTIWHGWELQMANQVDSGTFTKAPVYFVKTAQGGSIIASWDTGSVHGYWDSLTKRMDTAVTMLTKINQGTPPKIFLFYSQGINDSKYNPGMDTATWITKTIAHFAKIRARYGHVPIFMTYLPPENVAFNAAITTIASEVSEVYTIQTSDATLISGDADHWDYAGMKLIARRMITALLSNYTP